MSFIPDSHHVKSRCKTYRQPQCHMAGYLIYTKQNYLDCDLSDINLDCDPEDAPFTRDIHCSI